MKSKNQASVLEKMMQKHFLLTKYTLAIAPLDLDKKSFKKFKKSEPLALGKSLKFVILLEHKIIAHISLEKAKNKDILSINTLCKESLKEGYIILSTFKAKALEENMNIEIKKIDFENISIYDKKG